MCVVNHVCGESCVLWIMCIVDDVCCESCVLWIMCVINRVHAVNRMCVDMTSYKQSKQEMFLRLTELKRRKTSCKLWTMQSLWSTRTPPAVSLGRWLASLLQYQIQSTKSRSQANTVTDKTWDFLRRISLVVVWKHNDDLYCWGDHQHGPILDQSCSKLHIAGFFNDPDALTRGLRDTDTKDTICTFAYLYT